MVSMATAPSMASSLSEKLHQHRRHLAQSRSAARLTMESLAETEAETETDNESSTLVPRNNLQVAGEDVEQPRCTPFFGVKHYLHNFYALPEDNTDTLAQAEADAYLFGSSHENGVSKLRRGCFRYSLALGAFFMVVGVVGLLLGYFLPRHDIIVGRIEENDLKTWVAVNGFSQEMKAFPRYSELEILDKYAVEYNSLLDTLKIGGLVAICLGALLAVLALIIPHSPAAADDERSLSESPSPTKLGRTIQRCLPNLCRKQTTPTSAVELPTSLSLGEEKIPICEHVKRIQPSL